MCAIVAGRATAVTRVCCCRHHSPAYSPRNMYALERRHNFETRNRPQVANRKVQPSEWTTVFPFIRCVWLWLHAAACGCAAVRTTLDWHVNAPTEYVVDGWINTMPLTQSPLAGVCRRLCVRHSQPQPQRARLPRPTNVMPSVLLSAVCCHGPVLLSRAVRVCWCVAPPSVATPTQPRVT